MTRILVVDDEPDLEDSGQAKVPEKDQGARI